MKDLVLPFIIKDMKTQFGNVTIELTEGDIAFQEGIDAVVNAANAELRIGGGVAGAIHRAAGPGLEEESRRLAPIRPGEAVMTGAHQLPNRHVIHCLGPVYARDEPSDVLLANCYRNALRLAEESELSAVAFPSISTGAFGYPMEDAARIALETVREEAHSLLHVRTIRFVLFGRQALDAHRKVLQTLQ